MLEACMSEQQIMETRLPNFNLDNPYWFWLNSPSFVSLESQSDHRISSHLFSIACSVLANQPCVAVTVVAIAHTLRQVLDETLHRCVLALWVLFRFVVWDPWQWRGIWIAHLTLSCFVDRSGNRSAKDSEGWKEITSPMAVNTRHGLAKWFMLRREHLWHHRRDYEGIRQETARQWRMFRYQADSIVTCL